MLKVLKLNKDNINDYIDIIHKYEESVFNDEAYSKELLLNSITGYDNIDILLDDKTLIGYIIYRYVDVIHLLKIFIDDKFKGNGYAKLLLDNMIENSNGINKVYLEVRKNNISAIRFYEKNNFQIIDTKKNYFINPNDDALIMVKND